MGHLQDFHERYGDQGLLVFAISMHPDRGKALGWTRELGVTYPVLDGHRSALGERLAYG
jgi:hypothetical protein